MEKIIDLKDITVKYGDNVILDKLNLSINKKRVHNAAWSFRLRQNNHSSLLSGFC